MPLGQHSLPVPAFQPKKKIREALASSISCFSALFRKQIGPSQACEAQVIA
jgi:hypothetical protein